MLGPALAAGKPTPAPQEYDLEPQHYKGNTYQHRSIATNSNKSTANAILQ